MSSPLQTGTGPPQARATSRAATRLAHLEEALGRAREERLAQNRAVEGELERLSSIYDRMRSDLESARRERDLAMDEARHERERRARETLELAERLEEAVRQERERASAASEDSREQFVRDRLAEAPLEHRNLIPGEMPEVRGFKISELIGRGGMASVFRAERQEVGDEVALKILHGKRASSRARAELFLREAALMLQLDHPGLLRALDAGDCAHGLYLVLPLIRGRSLATRVRQDGPVSELEAVRIGLDIGRALRYCARAGLTHRDVKPSNILEDENGHVRLCDFGLAALHTGDAGRPYGSPGYAAPEQLATPDQVDERADIYALGCTLWHLVVGRRAFTGGPKEAFDEARQKDLPDPRLEGGDISPRLAQVVRRMGRCRRSRRYRTWDECLLDLMLVEKGNPPLAAHLSDALSEDAESCGPVDVDATGGAARVHAAHPVHTGHTGHPAAHAALAPATPGVPIPVVAIIATLAAVLGALLGAWLSS